MTDDGLRPAEQALLERLPVGSWTRHGIPEPDQRRRRSRALVRVREVLSPDAIAHVDVSVLGADWSSDIDVSGDVTAMRADLDAAGWPCLDPWLEGIGSKARDVFAIVGDGEVLSSLDLVPSPVRPDPTPPDPVAQVLGRARRRGEVRLRELLELMRLEADGSRLSEEEGVVVAARRLQADPAMEPVTLRYGRVRRAVAVARTRVRPRLVIAFSGVDGAGKSTNAAALQEALERCGLPVSRVWARPGMNLGVLDSMARLVKRASGGDPDPGVRRVAAGATDVSSRRGLLGWAWSLLVAVAFATDVARQHASARGVVLYDRHVPDALATLDVLYGGADLRLQRWIVRRALPAAALTVYLHVDADTAVARKPDDPIGWHAVTAQLARYDQHLERVPAVEVVDALMPVPAITLELLQALGRARLS